MSQVINAEPDMNKKVKFDRGEMEERIVDIYISADTMRDGETSTKREETADTAPNNGPGDQQSEPDSSVKRPFLVAAVFLGLLCVLLAGIIGLSVYCEFVSKFIAYHLVSFSLFKINATEERDQLQTRYNNLAEERDQLQTSYNNLTEERDQLQTLCSSTEQHCQEGWRYFDSSLYFLSTEKKTWEESRQDCKGRGADLVIINSREEQYFINILRVTLSFSFSTIDISLQPPPESLDESDSVTEETWKWVDGTTLTTGYWGKGQPNNGGLFPGQEDCVEIYYRQADPVQTWNDDNCGTNHNWICEKEV
ncbi:C-type lectin domain family 6 member A-like [Oncorhynchus nerka]|uniref:C-type lectin domain family 6 member A-like n=1 Tax=Oncorhynchus nerka TaxID=8023 RepID=UPI0031B87323